MLSLWGQNEPCNPDKQALDLRDCSKLRPYWRGLDEGAATMKTQADLADELLKMIDAGVSNKQATEWLASYQANFGTAMIAEIFALLGTKLRDRAEEYEREVEQSLRKATRD